MRKLYDGQIVDYNDGDTEFVREFNDEIIRGGAIVYNHEDNSYQWITSFDQIAFKRELDPFYFKIETGKLPKSVEIQMKYAFDPDTEEDEEILKLWKEASTVEYPYYEYDEDGEIYEKEYYGIHTKPTKHTIWILDDTATEVLYGYDSLLFMPIIKKLEIVQKLVQHHAIAPWDDAQKYS